MSQSTHIARTHYELLWEFPFDFKSDVLSHRWAVLGTIDVLRVSSILQCRIEVGRRRECARKSAVPVESRLKASTCTIVNVCQLGKPYLLNQRSAGADI